MAHPLLDYIRATDDTQAGFAARIGVSRRTLGRIISGERAPKPEIARRIVEATGGAVSLELLLGADKGVLSDLSAIRADEEVIDSSLLGPVLRHALGTIANPTAPSPSQQVIEAAAEAAANTHAALARVTTRHGRDRLSQALLPVLEEIRRDFPELGLDPGRMNEAVRTAVVLYYEAKPRLR